MKFCRRFWGILVALAVGWAPVLNASDAPLLFRWLFLGFAGVATVAVAFLLRRLLKEEKGLPPKEKKKPPRRQHGRNPKPNRLKNLQLHWQERLKGG